MADKRKEENFDENIVIKMIDEDDEELGMADKRKEEYSDEDIVIKMTDEDGNVFYFLEEMIIPVDGENYAFLIELHEDHDEHCDCEDDVIIAKIVVNDKGQEEYVEPTDEEFEKVQAVYEKILDEEE